MFFFGCEYSVVFFPDALADDNGVLFILFDGVDYVAAVGGKDGSWFEDDIVPVVLFGVQDDESFVVDSGGVGEVFAVGAEDGSGPQDAVVYCVIFFIDDYEPLLAFACGVSESF